jgi:hypothetical protein
LVPLRSQGVIDTEHHRVGFYSSLLRSIPGQTASDERKEEFQLMEVKLKPEPARNRIEESSSQARLRTYVDAKGILAESDGLC